MNKGVPQLENSSEETRLAELMKKAQGGDSHSYRMLLLEIEKMTSRFVKNSFYRFGIGNSDSWEDVVQEILLSIHAKRATYDPKQFFLPWFYSIARYKIIDHARRVKTISKFFDLELDLIELEATYSLVESENTQRDLLNLFECLPQKQRQVIELVKINGLTVAEAATKLGLSQSDIKVTIHRAIKFLQKKLKGELFNANS